MIAFASVNGAEHDLPEGTSVKVVLRGRQTEWIITDLTPELVMIVDLVNARCNVYVWVEPLDGPTKSTIPESTMEVSTGEAIIMVQFFAEGGEKGLS